MPHFHHFCTSIPVNLDSSESGHDRADGVTRFYRGSYQCSNEQCPSNQKEWDDKKKRYVKPNWRKLAEAATV